MDQEEIENSKNDAPQREEPPPEIEDAVQEETSDTRERQGEEAPQEEALQREEVRQQRLSGLLGQAIVVAGQNIWRAIHTKPIDTNGANRREPEESKSAAILTTGKEVSVAKADEMAYKLAQWQLRRDIPLAILAWIGVLYIVLMSAQHIGRTLSVVMIAALLAYALTPAVSLFKRFMPQFLAIAAVYLIVLGGIGALLYVIIQAAIQQFTTLSGFLNVLLSPGGNGELNDIARAVGMQPAQIESIRQQMVNQAQGAAGSIVPFVTGVFGTIVDMIVVAVLSIYFLIDGKRVMNWLRRSAPLQQRGRVVFALDTLQRIVGGYIRGQILLCTLISVLVGVGMQLMGVPYALLLGVMTFILEFIPILGTFITGVVCVLLALTKGWILALVVLIYFIIVHIIEGDIVGPRVVGRSVGLHPIVALAALIAGGELFGIWGALFASPVAGVLQAFLIAIWVEWRERHQREF